MPTFGNDPSDVVTNSRGDVLAGVVLSVHASQADAVAGSNALTSVTSSSLGRWTYTHASLTLVWVRTPSGAVFSVVDPTLSAGAASAAAATADAKAVAAQGTANTAQSSAAASAASAAASAALVGAPADTVVNAVIVGPGTAARASLNAAFVNKGLNDHTGSTPFLEVDNAGSGASFHLVAVPGATAPYMFGIGINADNNKGLVLDVTNNGCMGGQVVLFAGAGPASYGLAMSNSAVGSTLLDLAQISNGSTLIGPALRIDVAGSGATKPPPFQIVEKHTITSLIGVGPLDADTFHMFANGTYDFSSPLMRKNGGIFRVQTPGLDPTNDTATIDHTDLDGRSVFMRIATGDGRHYNGKISGRVGNGGKLETADATVRGAATSYAPALEWSGVPGWTKLGFFEKAPIERPAHPTTLADVIAVLANLGLTA